MAERAYSLAEEQPETRSPAASREILSRAWLTARPPSRAKVTQEMPQNDQFLKDCADAFEYIEPCAEHPREESPMQQIHCSARHVVRAHPALEYRR